MSRRSVNHWQKRLIRQHLRSAPKTLAKLSRNPRHDSNQGFALTMALGMGLIMLLVGVTMILRSQDDQVTASLQKQTSQGLAIAEGGTARILGLLNDNYYPFLRRSYDPDERLGSSVNEWSTISNAPPCFSSATFTDDLLTGRISNDNATEPSNYTLLAYRYDSATQRGTLLVRGKDEASDAVSVVQQTFRINDVAAPANFPGLLSSDINLGNNDVLGSVSGNIICTSVTNCPVSACMDGEPTEDALRSAVGAKNNSVVQGEIRVGEAIWPPLPTAPAGATNLGNISGSTTLPNGGTLIDNAYHYIVGNINLSGSNTLTINTSSAPVYLYVTGNISMGGSSTISHSGSSERFRIYGNPADSNNSNNQTFTLSGGSTATNIFIYAPDADMGINGGSSNPDIRGAVWTRTWNIETGSSSNNVEISVPDNMGALLGGNLQQASIRTAGTSATASWQRRPAQ